MEGEKGGGREGKGEGDGKKWEEEMGREGGDGKKKAKEGEEKGKKNGVSKNHIHLSPGK